MGEPAAVNGKGTAMEVAEGQAQAVELVAVDEGGVEALEEEVRLLDEILAVWRERALAGIPEAVDTVLELQKQRLVLKRLWPAGSAGMKVSAGAASRGDEREVRVVVEYVDDWRQVGRRSGD